MLFAGKKRVRRMFTAAVAALCLALSSCGAFTDAPEIESVDEASETSPRFFEGADTALLASDDVTPITTNPKPQLPVTFTGLDDVSVEVTDTSRILALDGSGSLASIVFGLGFGPNVVGRDLTTGFESAKDLPLVMDNHTLNAEAILDLEPTLVLTDYSVGPYDVQMQLRQAGIPVIFFEQAEGFEDIHRQINDVATALGVPELGEEYSAHFDERMEKTRAWIKEVTPQERENKIRMVFLYMRGQANVYYMFGNNPDGSQGAAGVLIEAIGGVDVAGELDWKSGALTAEGLLKLEPDLYLMLTLGLESVGGVEGLMQIPGVADTPAGKRQRVVDMSDYVMFSWGPRTPDILQSLVSTIYRVEIPEELKL